MRPLSARGRVALARAAFARGAFARAALIRATLVRAAFAAGLPAWLGACAGHLPPANPLPPAGPWQRGPVADNPHIPPFADAGWGPFSRQAAIAIALREWRGFGAPVDDAPPEGRPEPPADRKPERSDGHWQRIGEYWWEGLDPGSAESAYTGKHDQAGHEFPATADANYAWSAAFISYVMRLSGAGARFPYAPTHSTYINAAASNAAPGLAAFAPQAYTPTPGDLICTGRGAAAALRFADLPTAGSFPAHCDIVVDAAPGLLTVIGGNVDDAVTAKHVPVGADGRLADPDGRVRDTRYPWLVVLRVMYDDAPRAVAAK